MRKSSTTTQILLQSVAVRYRTPLASGVINRGAIRRLWGAQKQLVNAIDQTYEQEDDPHQKMANLQAVLFLARDPLTSRKLSQYARLADGTEARTLVRRLNQQLDQVGRAFRVQEVAGGFQLTTRPKFAKWLRRLDYVPGALRLSAPSLETLAVVAYRQPVLRSDIEAIRGVSCGEILNQLMERDLIRVGGRSSELGRPYLYNTTKRFLQVFGLRSLDELPRVGIFRDVAETTPAVPSGTEHNVEEKALEGEEDWK